MLFYFCLTALAALKIFKTKNNREEQTRRNNTNRPCGCLFFIDRICTHLLTPSLMRCLYVTIFNEFSIRTHHKTACGKYLYVYILIFCACICECDVRFFFFFQWKWALRTIIRSVSCLRFLTAKTLFLHTCMHA